MDFATMLLYFSPMSFCRKKDNRHTVKTVIAHAKTIQTMQDSTAMLLKRM